MAEKGERGYFAGGNTGAGFVSCFEAIAPRRLKRAWYIKGAAGVGKSTLMRRVAERWEAAGETVERFYCASDSDSLDGIAAPDAGLCVMDATPPHVMEPRVVGARDVLLPLGDCLDARGLSRRAEEIGRIQGDIGRCFARAYHYLRAASAVWAGARAAFAHAADGDGLRALTDALTERLPKRGGRGVLRTLFGAAVTPQGVADRVAALPRGEAVALTLPFGADADALLRTLAARAEERGLFPTLLLDPVLPDTAAHLYLPDHGLLFTTGDAPDAQDTHDLTALCGFTQSAAKENAFDRNAWELLLLRAREQLRAAKALHDELERVYGEYMDFGAWEGMLERVE